MNELDASSDANLDTNLRSEHPVPSAMLGSERDPFSRALRVLGALLLATSASTFMFQNWDQQSDVVRYFMLLGHTVVLVLAGVLCGSGLQAARSARTLLGLVLACVPVHGAVLGALLYSRLGAASADLPSSAIWAAPSLGAALLSVAAALVVLVPVGMVSLRVLAPGHVRTLGLTFAGMNAALLVPVREPALIGALLLACTLVMLVVDKRFEAEHALRTFEGRLCRALCFVPVAILAGRTGLYYEPTAAFMAACLLAVAFIWFSFFERFGITRDATVAQRAAVLPVGIAASLLSGLIANETWSQTWSQACFAVLYTALLAPMARRALGGGAFYAAVAGYAACATLLFDAMVSSSTTSALLALLGGSAVLVVGALVQRLGLLLAAALTTLIAVVIELWLVVDLGALRHWGTLALAGLILMLGAALLERHGKRFGQQLRSFRDELTVWAW